MNRRKYLAATGAAAFGTSLAGCTEGENFEPTDDGDTTEDVTTGTLSTAISDGPSAIEDFESLVVTVEEIRLFPKGADETTGEEEESDAGAEDGAGDETDSDDESDGEGDVADQAEGGDTPVTNNDGDESGSDADDGNDGGGGGEDGSDDSDENESETGDPEPADAESGPRTIAVDDAQVDLVQVTGERQSLIDESDVATGEYSHLQLRISDEIDATLVDADEDDEAPTVTTAGNAPLQFNAQFEVREDERTMFVADFAPFRGGPEDYQLRPVPDEIRVLYGADAENADDEGQANGGEDDADETDE